MKLYLQIALLLTLASSACEKGGSTDTITPTNLQLNAVVATDSSGNVQFTASATNAVSYEYDYGNGVFGNTTSGSIAYRYPSAGTYTVKVTAKSSTGHTATKSTVINVAVAMRLIWSDEFNTPGTPDPTKWTHEIGAGGWGNQELQYYTNRLTNSEVSNGTLKINAIKEPFSGSNYTSARLVTKDKFNFTYGVVEARAKLPSGNGVWPAIWMLGANINTVSWPACGEIDIMEFKGSQPTTLYGTLHYPGRSGGNAHGTTTQVQNMSTQFHVYKVEWNAANIKFFVDGNEYFNVPNSSSLPFNHNFFIILNVAMGGTFGGPVDPAFTNSNMEIDYVRVYQ